MFQHLSLGSKIGGGFALVILGTLGLGITGILALASLQHAQDDNSRIIEIRRTMYDARIAATRFSLRYDDQDAENARAELVKVRKEIKGLVSNLTPEEATALTRMSELLDAYDQHMQTVQETVAKARVEAGKPITEIPGVMTL